jgi:hypothetical protein
MIAGYALLASTSAQASLVVGSEGLQAKLPVQRLPWTQPETTDLSVERGGRVGGGRACTLELQGLVGAIENPALTNTYELWGTVQITDPPATGDLLIRVEGGTTQIIEPPFAASEPIVVPGLYADGALRQVEAVFVDAPTCTTSVSFTAPTGAGLILDQGYVAPVLIVPGPFTSPGFAGQDLTNNLFSGGVPNDTSAVRIPFSIADKGMSDYTSFCTELGESIALATYTNDFRVSPLEASARGSAGATQESILVPTGGIGRAKAGKLRWLFDNYFLGTGAVFTNRQAAAFQIAMWDITHDHFDGTSQSVIGATTDGLYLTQASGFRTDANNYLSQINALGFSDAEWEAYASTTWHPILLESIDAAGGRQDITTAVTYSSSPDFGGDWGDLPAGYPTLLADNGARHTVGRGDAHLGVFRPDSDSNGQPSATAAGDNQAYVDDEDGITPFSQWTPGLAEDQTLWFQVDVGSPGYLSLFIDVDAGTPSTLTRATLTEVAGGPAPVTVPAGTANFGDIFFSQAGSYFAAVTLPAGTAGASVATRWRITNAPSQGGNSATGVASTGEVEDYIFTSDEGVPVTLASFESDPSTRGGQTVRWSTASEIGNLGFRLYGEDRRGHWHELLPELELSRVVDSDSPQNYSVTVPNLQIQRFLLEDVDVFGKSKLHGPFEAGRSFGRSPTPERIDWVAIRGASEQAAARRGQSWVGLPFRNVQLGVAVDGVHRVSYEELESAGLIQSPIAIENLRLTRNGSDVPLHLIGGEKQFGPGAEIEFFGRKPTHQYSDEAIYQLGVVYDLGAVKSVPGQDATIASVVRPDPNRGPLAPVDTGIRRVAQARERFYSASSVAGTPWADTRMVVQQTPKSWDFSFDVVDPVEAAARLSLTLSGVTDFPEVDLDYHVEVLVNDVLLGSHRFKGRTNAGLDFRLPPGLLAEGANRLTLRMPGDSGAPVAVVNLIGFEVDYSSDLVLDRETLVFEAQGSAIRIDGLHTRELSVYRQSGVALARLQPADFLSWPRAAVVLRGTDSPATYHVAPPEGILRPSLSEAPPVRGLVEGQADYLIIAHSDFTGGLAALRTFHEQRGLSVRIVDVEQIYAAYSGGNIDPYAIEAFIDDAAPAMGVQYILLIGGDTWDYRNSAGTNSISFIPSIYVRTSDLVQFAPSDSVFADLDDDGIQDLPIGRLPVRTPGELAAVILKTRQYAARNYSDALVLSADRQDPGLSFADQSDAFFGLDESEWWITRAYLDELSVTEARSALIGGVDAGASLTSFFGHSAASVWTFEGLFSSSDVALLSNASRPTAVVQFGCWNTYHVVPEFNTLGHAWMLEANRGAALVMGSSTFTQIETSRQFGQLLIPELLTPGQSAGQAVVEAKRRLADLNPQALDMLLGWTILGDPALEIAPSR